MFSPMRETLCKQLGQDLTLEIFSDEVKPAIFRKGSKCRVKLSLKDYLGVHNALKSIRKTKNDEMWDLGRSELSRLFPKDFKSGEDVSGSRDRLTDLLQAYPLSKLSKTDLKTLGRVYPEFIKNHAGTIRSADVVQIGIESEHETKRIMLNSVIKEYKELLNKDVLNEEKWQKFFEDNILVFDSNYQLVIARQMISLAKKNPDLMLVDIYNYLDSFELKTAYTHKFGE